MREITIDEMIQCVRREIAMRKKVYPKRVEKRKMGDLKAQHEIDIMEAILMKLETEAGQRLL